MSSSIRDDDGVSNPGGNATLDEVLQRSLAANPARRRLMLAGLGAAVVPFLSACGGGDDDPVAPPPAPAPPPPPPEALLGFTAIATSSDDDVKVPAGYVATAFIPWGEPINDLAPAFKADAANSAAEQDRQVGDNHDGMSYFPIDGSNEGLLVMNHEYCNYGYLFGAEFMTPWTAEKVSKALNAHGVSVLHVKKNGAGRWEVHIGSPYNRRITGKTPMTLTGPPPATPSCAQRRTPVASASWER